MACHVYWETSVQLITLCVGMDDVFVAMVSALISPQQPPLAVCLLCFIGHFSSAMCYIFWPHKILGIVMVLLT